MKLNRLLQFIFIAMVIIGVFAAMARNAYGFDLIGIACLGITLLYVIQVGWKVVGEYGTLARDGFVEIAELLLLAALTFLFGLRAFYIYLSYGEIIFRVMCVLLVIVYLVSGNSIVSSVRRESKPMAQKLSFFYAAVIFFLLAILTGPKASVSITFGWLAILASIPFLYAVIKGNQFDVKSKHISLLQFVIASRTKSGILFLCFISAALFVGLAYLRVLPSIENAERPKDYIELITNAESGKEKPVEGHYKHEEYKAAMDNFLKRHASR